MRSVTVQRNDYAESTARKTPVRQMSIRFGCLSSESARVRLTVCGGRTEGGGGMGGGHPPAY